MSRLASARTLGLLLVMTVGPGSIACSRSALSTVTSASWPPALAITSPAPSATVGLAGVSALTVEGTCSDDGRPIEILAPVGSATTCHGGFWSLPLDLSPVPDGDVEIRAAHPRESGEAAVAALHLRKDTVPPVVTFLAPAPGTRVPYEDSKAVSISGTCSEPELPVLVTGAAVAATFCAGGLWATYVDLSGVPPGEVTVAASQTDAAGNASTPVELALVRAERLRPYVTIDAPDDGAWVNAAGAAEVSLSGTCSEEGLPVEIDGAGSGQTPCLGGAWSATLDLRAVPDGSVSVRAVHSAPSGRQSIASLFLRKDTIAPVVAFTAPAPGTGVDDWSPVTVAGTCTEPSVDVAIALGSTVRAARCSEGLFALDVDLANVADGQLRFEATQSDEAGNVSVPATLTLIKEKRPTRVYVRPFYPVHGAAWNDWIKGEPGADPWHRSDVACRPSDLLDGPDPHCIHAGELRRVDLPKGTSCGGLTIEDALGAFEWACREGDGHATFFTTGLAPPWTPAVLLDDDRWRDEAVVVYQNGEAAYASSPGAWWPNAVEPLPENGTPWDAPVVLDRPGTIYTVRGARRSQGVVLAADRLSIVGLGYGVERPSLSWAGGAVPSCQAVDDLESRCLISGRDAHFAWLQDLVLGGAADGYSADFGVWLVGAEVMTAQRLVASDFRRLGFELYGGAGSRVFDLEVSRNGEGAYFDLCSGLYAKLIKARDNQGTGFKLYYSRECYVGGIYSEGNGGRGAELYEWRDLGPNSNIGTVHVSGNGGDGLYAMGPYAINGVVAANNAGYSVDAQVRALYDVLSTSSKGMKIRSGVLVQATHANSQDGLEVAGPNVTILNAAIVGNARRGLVVDATSGVTIAQLAASDNAEGNVVVDPAAEARFVGNLLVGGAGGLCTVSGPVVGHPGVVDGTCTLSGTDGSHDYPAGDGSSAVLRLGRDASSSFYGPVYDRDPYNRSNQSGAAPYADIVDWLQFANLQRTWGREPADYPTPDASCHEGTCRIWDWRLLAGDTVLLDRTGDGAHVNDPFPTDPTRPCPAQASASSAHDANGNVFLLNAVAPIFETWGDDDGLCESGEECVFARNFGEYQGEGYFQNHGCAFGGAGGPVSGVRLFGYLENGVTP